MVLSDIQAPLALGRGWIRLRFLAMAAGLLLIGVLALLALRERGGHDGARGLYALIAAWSVLALGLFLFAREAYRLARPGPPLLALSPQGVSLNVDGARLVEVPWREVEDLAVIDVTTRTTLPVSKDYAGRIEIDKVIRENYRDVIALVVSEHTYERRAAPARRDNARGADLATRLGLRDGMIHHIPARNGLGLGWSSIFIPRGDQVLVALHHSMLPISAARLRAEVESRWRALGPPAATP